MIIKDAKLLALFRAPGRCELCGRWCRKRCGHHAIKRGLGGGRRLDIRDNLCAVGDSHDRLTMPPCPCHRQADDGTISRERVLEIIASREGWPSPEALGEYLAWLAQTATKWTTAEEVAAKRAELRRKAA